MKKNKWLHGKYSYVWNSNGFYCDKYGLYEYVEEGTPIKTTERVRRYLNKRNLGKR